MKYPTMRRQHSITVSFYAIFSASIFLGEITGTQSFSSTGHRLVKVNAVSFNDESTVRALATSSVETDYSFIQTELRGAAMKLHTRAQSPKEGQVPDSPKPTQPYVTTHSDYLAFLVDSQEVYRAMEEVVQTHDALIPFRNTGMERCAALETDVCFLTQEYKLERPSVGKPGREYATHLRQIVSIPEFMCHFYNHYFAHTAGGRMIGKQMSALLLDKKTLEFYKVRCSSRGGACVFKMDYSLETPLTLDFLRCI